MNPILLSMGLVAGLCVGPAFAQLVEENSDDRRIAPQTGPKNLEPTVRLPSDLPDPAKSTEMTPFLVPDLKARQTFAFDPASFRVEGTVVMMTVTATSTAGAQTSGYYAFNCDRGQYRMLGLSSGGKWKASSRTKWHNVLGIKRRPSQFVPLYSASCNANGTSVSTVQELTARLFQYQPETD